jgi:ribonuclease HI
MNKLIIYSDGGARDNPGPAGIGVVINDETGKTIAEISEFLGVATNNQAEYRALLAGLEKALVLGAVEVVCYLDSELVVKQMRGEYRVKNKDLALLFVKAHNLTLRFTKVTFKHIPREMNKAADKLANDAMDYELNR